MISTLPPFHLGCRSWVVFTSPGQCRQPRDSAEHAPCIITQPDPHQMAPRSASDLSQAGDRRSRAMITIHTQRTPAAQPRASTRRCSTTKIIVIPQDIKHATSKTVCMNPADWAKSIMAKATLSAWELGLPLGHSSIALFSRLGRQPPLL